MTNIIRTLPLALLLACLFSVTGCKSGDVKDTAIGTTDGAISGDTATGGTVSGQTATGGSAATLTFTWDPPTTYDDNTTPLTVAGYKIYYGSSSGGYTSVVDLNSYATTTDASGLFTGVSGTLFFAVTAYDAAGLESDFSIEVSRYVGP